MVSSIGYNTSIEYKMMFDFNIPNFKFKARVRKTKYGYLVMEIIKVKEKRINFNEIRVFHPSFEKYARSDKAKKWSYVSLSNNGDNKRTIDNDTDGSTKAAETIKDELVVQEYLNIPKIKKEKTGHANRHEREDENTKKFGREDDDRRTFVDDGGFNKTKGIEASGIDVKSVSGELKEFIAEINLLRSLQIIDKIEMEIVNLPLGRKFSYVHNKKYRRRCVLVKIKRIDGCIIIVIEVEKEERGLSTLMLISYKEENWNKICFEILKGLVNQSGKWSNDVFEKIETNTNIVVKRIRHIKKNRYEFFKRHISFSF